MKNFYYSFYVIVFVLENCFIFTRVLFMSDVMGRFVYKKPSDIIVAISHKELQLNQ